MVGLSINTWYDLNSFFHLNYYYAPICCRVILSFQCLLHNREIDIELEKVFERKPLTISWTPFSCLWGGRWTTNMKRMRWRPSTSGGLVVVFVLPLTRWITFLYSLALIKIIGCCMSKLWNLECNASWSTIQRLKDEKILAINHHMCYSSISHVPSYLYCLVPYKL